MNMNFVITRYGFQLHDLGRMTTSKISVSTSVKWKYHLLSHRVVKEIYGIKWETIKHSTSMHTGSPTLSPTFRIDKYHWGSVPKRWEGFCRDKCFSTSMIGAEQWSQAPESWLPVLFRTSLVCVRRGPITQEGHHPQKGKCVRKNAAGAPASRRASWQFTL